MASDPKSLDDAIFSRRRHPLMPEKSLLVKLARLAAATGRYLVLDREIRQWVEDMRERGEIE